jgi:hypothetical protein
VYENSVLTSVFSITRCCPLLWVVAAKFTRLTSQNSDTTALNGRELYHLQFSLRAANL